MNVDTVRHALLFVLCVRPMNLDRTPANVAHSWIRDWVDKFLSEFRKMNDLVMVDKAANCHADVCLWHIKVELLGPSRLISCLALLTFGRSGLSCRRF